MTKYLQNSHHSCGWHTKAKELRAKAALEALPACLFPPCKTSYLYCIFLWTYHCVIKRARTTNLWLAVQSGVQV